MRRCETQITEISSAAKAQESVGTPRGVINLT
jgi:hypothetical protein